MTITIGKIGASFARASLTRSDNKFPAAVRVHLEAEDVLNLKPARRIGRNAAMRVECVSGQLWVTQPGDPVDHILAAGDAFQAHSPGALIVQAMRESSVRIMETA